MALGWHEVTGMKHLDTHIAVWLAAGDKRRLKSVRKELSRGQIFVSPFVVLELEFLFEVGRIRARSGEVLSVLEEHGVAVCDGNLRDLVPVATSLAWTRDPFDRLIVAHSLERKAKLITMDETILANAPNAIC